jgi:outer membrane lipoprotein-sorting protein
MASILVGAGLAPPGVYPGTPLAAEHGLLHLYLCAAALSAGSDVLRWHPAATIRQSVRRRGLPLKKTVCLTALLVLSVLACAVELGADQTTGRWTSDSVLAMMDKSAADFRSLTADIEHIKYTDVVKDTSTETGQIFVRRDQKMRIEITKPDPRTILRSGDSLYVFTPKINRVEEYDLGKNRAMVDQYVLLGFGTKSQEVLKSYNVSLTAEEELDQRKTLVLELTPKSDDIRRQITKIEMWIDEASWLPIQQKFYEAAAGDYFLFHYSDIKKNLKISDSKFKQDWPKDVNRVKPHA